MICSSGEHSPLVETGWIFAVKIFRRRSLSALFTVTKRPTCVLLPSGRLMDGIVLVRFSSLVVFLLITWKVQASVSVFLSCKQTRQLFIDPSQNGTSAHLHIRHLLLGANGAVTIGNSWAGETKCLTVIVLSKGKHSMKLQQQCSGQRVPCVQRVLLKQACGITPGLWNMAEMLCRHLSS